MLTLFLQSGMILILSLCLFNLTFFYIFGVVVGINTKVIFIAGLY